MQDRYVGDIGDFAKYSLISVLSEGRKLGIAWYLFPDESHNADGKHVHYLSQPNQWRSKHPYIFDKLQKLVQNNQRTTCAVIQDKVLTTDCVSGNLLINHSSSFKVREQWRKAWFSELISELEPCDFIFADPDNGLCLDENFKACNQKQWKRLPLSEANTLANGRPAVFYHHNTRRKGGHEAEISYWLNQLDNASFAIRFRAYSVRTFFVVGATDNMRKNARLWCDRFGSKASFHE